MKKTIILFLFLFPVYLSAQKRVQVMEYVSVEFPAEPSVEDTENGKYFSADHLTETYTVEFVDGKNNIEEIPIKMYPIFYASIFQQLKLELGDQIISKTETTVDKIPALNIKLHSDSGFFGYTFVHRTCVRAGLYVLYFDFYSNDDSEETLKKYDQFISTIKINHPPAPEKFTIKSDSARVNSNSSHFNSGRLIAKFAVFIIIGLIAFVIRQSRKKKQILKEEEDNEYLAGLNKNEGASHSDEKKI